MAKTGILSEEEASKLLEGLDKVAKEWENGSFVIVASDEDIHTANERRLSELIGASIGGIITSFFYHSSLSSFHLSLSPYLFLPLFLPISLFFYLFLSFSIFFYLFLSFFFLFLSFFIFFYLFFIFF